MIKKGALILLIVILTVFFNSYFAFGYEYGCVYEEYWHDSTEGENPVYEFKVQGGDGQKGSCYYGQDLSEEIIIPSNSACNHKGKVIGMSCDDDGYFQVENKKFAIDEGCICDEECCNLKSCAELDTKLSNNEITQEDYNRIKAKCCTQETHDTCVGNSARTNNAGISPLTPDNTVEGAGHFPMEGEPQTAKIVPIDKCGVSYGCTGSYMVKKTDDGDFKEECCSELSATWTGTVCCQAGTGSFYKDKFYKNDNHKGCWNGTVLESGEFPRETKDIIYYKDEFYGCRIDAENFIKGNNFTLKLKEYYTDKKLVQNKSYCSLAAENTYFCSYREEWKEIGSLAGKKIKISYAPWIEKNTKEIQKAECCPIDTCWDGKKCAENQAGKPQDPPNEHNYRCINGNWEEAYKVYPPDPEPGQEPGYCPRKDQCLVDLQGKPEDNDKPDKNPQCIANGQYIGDNYCENSVWTSRTKWLAAQLLTLAQDNYVLYCSEADKTLNALNYFVGTLRAEEAINITNNFCVLRYGDNLVLGTTINQPINSESDVFKEALGEKKCSVKAENALNPCSSSNKLWYNDNLKIAIYSKNSVKFDNKNAQSQYGVLLGNEISSLFNSIKTKIPSPHDSSIYNTGIKKARSLYKYKNGGKSVLGVMEGKQYKNVFLKYSGFSSDVCSYLVNYDNNHKTDGAGIKCESSSGSYLALAQGSIFSNVDPTNIWQDLTSKLRIK